MGVLNVTPDSFSDGGKWLDPDAAIAHGLQMAAEGAEIIDIGGESTRPGAEAVAEAEELRRVIPVVEAVSRTVTVSVDTRKAAVAEKAIEAGASIVNDISAELWEVAAAGRAGWIGMHCPADPSVMQSRAIYGDVVAEVRGYLVERASKAAEAGVQRVWIDPGIGFGKTARHNLLLLRHLSSLVDTGWPVAIGTSRKSFLGQLAAPPGGDPPPPSDRLEGSLATEAWAMTQGAHAVRVHDVAATVQLARLAAEPDRPEPRRGAPA
jgi:dihydropteroate synthase